MRERHHASTVRKTRPEGDRGDVLIRARRNADRRTSGNTCKGHVRGVIDSKNLVQICILGNTISVLRNIGYCRYYTFHHIGYPRFYRFLLNLLPQTAPESKKCKKCTKKTSLLNTQKFQKNSHKKWKKMQKMHTKMQKTHKKCKNRYIGSHRYIAGWRRSDMVLVYRFHHIGYPRYYRDVLDSITGLKHNAPGAN
jgi:hypothetical protein